MSDNLVKNNDFHSIEKSVIKYLNKEITLLSMISTIVMFANTTFDNQETREFYNFLINYMGDIELLYFMKGEENLYHNEVIRLVKEFQKELKDIEI